MHKLMRTVGFSTCQKKQNVTKLLKRLVKEAEVTGHLTEQEGSRLCELHTKVTPGIGVAMTGEMGLKGAFSHEYYFPYVKNPGVSSEAECSIQHHTEYEARVGFPDRYRAGISLTFYIENSMECRMRSSAHQPVQPRGTALTGLAVQGKVLLPVSKTGEQVEGSWQTAEKHSSLLEAARYSDEDTIEVPTIGDIDLCFTVSRRAVHEDIYSIIETCFMPCGTEYDQCSVIGEITGTSTSTDRITKEEIYDLKLSCNNMIFYVTINRQGLLDGSRMGRRFKGQVWIRDTVMFQGLCRMVTAVAIIGVII